ncbi:NAD(P)-dependent oxidoreductase [Leucobacter triazinivorans]|uniref:NAD(P)-dependent oxidoreductase n=1 Tax=Leucobacter triazinivorans TaxID=1784719 RepID=A0A4P6KFU7_9MICO|nr:NAD(P)-dependent oxidoreductase [Leucobacter triazinivorans]QBE49070.1 NAD(P)-dependent oxidoreductase [Leucobacter triazinivorans]
MSTVGFLGLGTMGRAMAARLVEAGHDVIVWNRSAGAVEELVSAGASAADTPADALAATLSFSMLANDAAVADVFSDEALLSCRARTHVMMSSISPALSDRLYSRFEGSDANYIAAPVLGRPNVAAAGQLNILAAGDESTIDGLAPYFEVLGKRTWYLGERPSVANAVKAAVNYNIIHAMQAIGESVAMTERLGVAPEVFTELLSSTLFSGVVYSGYGSIIAREEYHPPGFHVALGRKDLALAEAVAEATGVQPATMPALIAAFDTALADPELREGDWSVIAETSRRQGS